MEPGVGGGGGLCGAPPALTTPPSVPYWTPPLWSATPGEHRDLSQDQSPSPKPPGNKPPGAPSGAPATTAGVVFHVGGHTGTGVRDIQGTAPWGTAAPPDPGLAEEALTRLSPSGARGSVIQDPNLEPEVLTVTGSLMPVSLPQAGRQGTEQKVSSWSDPDHPLQEDVGPLCPFQSGCHSSW